MAAKAHRGKGQPVLCCRLSPELLAAIDRDRDDHARLTGETLTRAGWLRRIVDARLTAAGLHPTQH